MSILHVDFSHFSRILVHMDLKNLFKNCLSAEDRYQKIIELGRNLPMIEPEHKTPENIVQGCQSVTYLHTELKEGSLYFTASSDALISAGLAALLIHAYNGFTPEALLKEKPLFLEELGISTSLTPSRSNGVHSMFLRMQKDALKFLVLS